MKSLKSLRGLKSLRPIVSVVVPTYNRDKPLRRTLESLFQQNYPNFEIIVVDQSDKVFPEKERFLKKHQSRFRYFFLETPSIPKAINLGVRQAQGKIVFFTDDDVEVQKNLLQAHAANYKDQKIGGVQGRVVTKNQKEEPDFIGVGRVSPWGTVAGGFSSKIRQGVFNIIGCNVSFRKEIIKKIGCVDDNFIGNALRWETDLACRVIAGGWKIIFDPKAEITHLRAETGGCRKDENRLGWYHDFFHNETYFFLKHLAWYWWLVFWLTRWQWFLRCMFGFGREVSWRSVITPFLGIYHGWQAYRRQSKAKRKFFGDWLICLWLIFAFSAYFISWLFHLIEP